MEKDAVEETQHRAALAVHQANEAMARSVIARRRAAEALRWIDERREAARRRQGAWPEASDRRVASVRTRP